MKEEGYPKSFGLLELAGRGVGGTTGSGIFMIRCLVAGIWVLIRFLHGSLLLYQSPYVLLSLAACYREE